MVSRYCVPILRVITVGYNTEFNTAYIFIGIPYLDMDPLYLLTLKFEQVHLITLTRSI